MFAKEIPTAIEGFELKKEDSDTMKHLWPVGDDITDQVRFIFMHSFVRLTYSLEWMLHPDFFLASLSTDLTSILED